jgi:hypothetical protein
MNIFEKIDSLEAYKRYALEYFDCFPDFEDALDLFGVVDFEEEDYSAGRIPEVMEDAPQQDVFPILLYADIEFDIMAEPRTIWVWDSLQNILPQYFKSPFF